MAAGSSFGILAAEPIWLVPVAAVQQNWRPENMMRRLQILLGLIPLGACAAAAFQIHAATPPAPVIIERGAIPLPVGQNPIVASPETPTHVAPTFPVPVSTRAVVADANAVGPTSRGAMPTLPALPSTHPPVLPPAIAVRPTPPTSLAVRATVAIAPARAPKAASQPARTQPQTPATSESSVTQTTLESSTSAEAPDSDEGRSPTAESSASLTPVQQCAGQTRSGSRCRRKTRDASGFCYQHRGQATPQPE